ncbi:hypothetical protein D3C87_687610 [compost metagenome]
MTPHSYYAAIWQQRRTEWARYQMAETFFKPLFAAFIGEYLDMQTLKFNDTETTTGYEKLEHVLISAYKQAATGKGHDRHNLGGDIPFHDQRMQKISELIDSPLGMVYQACKKMTEAMQLPTHEKRVHELLGSINYTAGIIIFMNKAETAKFNNTMNFTKLHENDFAGGASTDEPALDKSEFVIPAKATEGQPATRADLVDIASTYKEKFGSDSARKVVKLFTFDGRIANVPQAFVPALTQIFRTLLTDNIRVGVDV